jgi:HlyD family secretion protein
MRRLAVILVLMAGTGLLYWQANSPVGGDANPGRQIVSVANASPDSAHFVTAPVELGSVRQVVSATGTLQALVTVEVGTQLSGQIAQLFADFNDEVSRGQALVQLDTKSFEARLAEAAAASAMARANVKIQRARLDRVRYDLQDAEAQRPVLQARVDSARLRLEAAQKAFERAEFLQQRNANSAIQVEEAASARDQSAAALREAQAIAAAHEHEIEGGSADLQRAEAELANALAGVPQKAAIERAAAIDLDRTTIRSPVDGVVVGRDVSEGQTVAASLESPTLFTIAGDLRQMEIHARVDEADIGKINVGQEAVFSVDAYPEHRFQAQVTGVRKSPQVIQNVVTYTVVLATENAERLLLPGMTATVRMTVHEAGPLLKLPLAALRYSPASEVADPPSADELVEHGQPVTVWRISQDGSLEPVRIGVGVDDGSHVEILDGALAEGDELVVSEVGASSSSRLFGIRFGF